MGTKPGDFSRKGMKPAVLKKVLFFAESMAEICAKTQVAPGRPLRWIIITNPTAGGFTLSPYWKKHHRTLTQYVSLARAASGREDCGPAKTAAGPPAFADCGLVATERAGSGMEIAGALVGEAASIRETMPFYLVIVAGGDGTSLEVLSVLFNAPETVR